MFPDEYICICIWIKIMYICDIYNLYDTMAWPASNIAHFEFYWKLQQPMFDKAAFQQIVLRQWI